MTSLSGLTAAEPDAAAIIGDGWVTGVSDARPASELNRRMGTGSSDNGFSPTLYVTVFVSSDTMHPVDVLEGLRQE